MIIILFHLHTHTRTHTHTHTHTHSYTQCDFEELQLDANRIFSQLLQDPAYDGAFQNLTFHSGYQVVVEAMEVLHSTPESEGEGVLSTEAEMVVSLLQQWLVSHLCKSLMNLMTSEALTLHRKNIPADYIDSYLTYQKHFNLKELICQHRQAMQTCNG